MSKYIIELNEDCKIVQQMCVTEHGNAYTDGCYSCDLEELNSDYINENYGELQDEAYQKGLEDAWEATKKIFGYEIDGAIPIADIGNVFGYEPCKAFCTADILRDFTVQEAIAKLKAYEDKHSDRIEVGDEIKVYDNIGVVTYIYGHHVDVMMTDGSTCGWELEELKKTGKHYDIASILEAMRTHD